MARSRQSRRQVPSMPMMQTAYPRLNVTRSGALTASATSTSRHYSHPRRRRGKRWHLGGARPHRARPIETSSVRVGFERIGQPDHGLCRAQHQKAVRLARSRKPVQYADLGVLIEVDQYVAAEDHVEHAELGEIVQQVELPVLNHGADVGIDLPELAVLPEVFDQHLNWQAALNLELTVDPRLRLLDHFLRNIRREDLNPPAGQRGAHLLQANRQRIRLLAGRTGGAPDPYGFPAGAGLQHLGHDRIAEVIEWA